MKVLREYPNMDSYSSAWHFSAEKIAAEKTAIKKKSHHDLGRGGT
jgi:hypothetical protein